MNSGFVWPDGIARDSLPIDRRLPEIMDALKSHQVVIVEGALGSGKTTRIAPYALQRGLGDYLPGKLPVILTLPRRSTVRFSGKRIAMEMNSVPGQVTGWKLAGEKPVVSKSTKIELMVTQSLVNQIRKRNGQLPNGLTIFDEAHENSLESHLLHGLLRENLKNSPSSSLIVSSGTIDVDRFLNFYEGAHSIKVEGSCYPVQTFVERLHEYEHHSQGASRVAQSIMSRFAEGKPLVNNEFDISNSEGTILVLLAGKGDIRVVKHELAHAASNLGISDRIEILTCHGESTSADQDAVIAPVRKGVLRFVLGTEVLRTSVTLAGIIGVIDSLQVKRFVCDLNGIGRLEKVTISRREADQGWGRAGRLRIGFYIPISFKDEYEKLQLDSRSVMQTSPLTSTVLQIAAVGKSAKSFSFLDQPDPKRLESAYTRLIRLGLLDENEIITSLGRKVVELPLQPEHAVILWAAKEKSVLAETAIVVSALEQGNIFDVPEFGSRTLLVDKELLNLIFREREIEVNAGGLNASSDFIEESLEQLPEWVTKEGNLFRIDCTKAVENSKRMAGWLFNLVLARWNQSGKSDFTAIVKAYRKFKKQEASLAKNSSGKTLHLSKSAKDKLRNWAEVRFLNWNRLRQLDHTLKLVCSSLREIEPGIDLAIVKDQKFDERDLSKSLLAGLFDQLGSRSRFGTFNGPVGEFSPTKLTICPTESKFVLAGTIGKENVGATETKMVNKASLMAPIKVEWIFETAPHLVLKTPIGQPLYYEDRDCVGQYYQCRFLTFDLGKHFYEVEDMKTAATIFANWFLSHLDQMKASSRNCLLENDAYLESMGRLQKKFAVNCETLVDPEIYHGWIREKLSSFSSLKGLESATTLEITHKEPVVHLMKRMASCLSEATNS